MKKLILLLFVFISICQLNAQIIKTGWVYGASGDQRAIKSFIDRSGNRYQAIYYRSNFIIDSAGIPITILKNPTPGYPFAKAIIKYDAFGRYLYHLCFYTTGTVDFFGWSFDIKFNSFNEAILCYTFSQYDSLSIYDAKGTLNKAIKPLYNKKITDLNGYLAAIACKLNPTGQIIWLNTITRETLPANSISGNFGKLLINNDNEIRVCFPNIRDNNSSVPDTLSVTNDTGYKTMFFVSTKYVIFKFGDNGNLLTVTEPLKNRLTFNHADSSYNQLNPYVPVVEMVTDGKNSFIILNISTTRADTIKCANPVPLKFGHTTLLFKLNENDSILWAIPIAKKILLNYTPTPSMNIDTTKQELMLLLDIAPWYYEFLLDPFFSSSYGSYLCKINTNGNLNWQDLYVNTTINTTNYNYVTKQYILAGSTNGNDLKLQKFTPVNLVNKSFSFVVYLDSLGNIFSAQPVFANQNQTGNNIQFGYYNIGSITDPKGRSYISGWFADSISLPCKKLHALVESNAFGTSLYDGFVLALDPYIPINLSACKQLSSPSGKYVWDSSGYYFDTIPNSLGCDSILWVNFKRLQSNSRLDSGVCKSMRSYSGKYVWIVSGTYRDTISNSKNCDSIITVNLTVLQRTSTLDSTVKIKMLSPGGKHVWDSTGTYKDTLITARGCYSILIIRLTVLQSKSTIDTTVCKSLLSPSGKYTYTVTGNYLDTISNKQNGDSIITLRLKILQTYHTIELLFAVFIKLQAGVITLIPPAFIMTL
ncbi:MAG: hypothetical protein H7296_09965 [Bacteroidia bacterium]|nr:hypothetical protein [Bacteroidia bacterium]